MSRLNFYCHSVKATKYPIEDSQTPEVHKCSEALSPQCDKMSYGMLSVTRFLQINCPLCVLKTRNILGSKPWEVSSGTGGDVEQLVLAVKSELTEDNCEDCPEANAEPSRHATCSVSAECSSWVPCSLSVTCFPVFHNKEYLISEAFLRDYSPEKDELWSKLEIIQNRPVLPLKQTYHHGASLFVILKTT